MKKQCENERDKKSHLQTSYLLLQKTLYGLLKENGRSRIPLTLMAVKRPILRSEELIN